MGGHTICNSVKPAGQGRALPNGGGLLCQGEEGGLERVLGVVDTSQSTQTDPHDHRSMPLHKCLKGRLVLMAQKGAEQGAVGLVANLSAGGQIVDMLPDCPKPCGGHRYLSRQGPRPLSYSARPEENVTSNSLSHGEKREEASGWGKPLAFIDESGGSGRGYEERAGGSGPTCLLRTIEARCVPKKPAKETICRNSLPLLILHAK